MIDIQTHYVPPAAHRLLADPRVGTVHGLSNSEPARSAIRSLDRRLKDMDLAGMAVSVLSFAPIGPLADRALDAALCRAANDGLLDACDAHPDRFVMAASLPLPDADAALAELNRLVGAPALRAVHVTADSTLYRPDEIGLEALLSTASGAGLPLILHPTAGTADLSPTFAPFGLASGFHAMVSHALVAARLIQSGLLDRCEGLTLILTHLGGLLPFLSERLDSRHTGPTRFPPSHYLKDRLYFDACGYSAGPVLRCALEILGHERLMIGSDWPSRPIAPAIEAIRGLGLEPDAERAILHDNAARWFDPLQR